MKTLKSPFEINWPLELTFWFWMGTFWISFQRARIGKGGLVEERLMYDSQCTTIFEFSFPVTLCLSFYELSFSVFESPGVSWTIEELSFLPFKNQNKSLVFISGLWAGKFRFQIFCWMLRIIVQHFYCWKSSVVKVS